MKSKSVKKDKKSFASGDTSGLEKKIPEMFSTFSFLAFAITFILSLAVYTFTLAPTVTLEDSGELVVAADYLGVPHPPGYPLWTILAWLFQKIFFFIKYMGHPNPAWGVNFLSAFFGSLSSATVAVLISCSGYHLLSHIRKFSQEAKQWLLKFIACISGISTGLLLAFTPLCWSQAVIAEVYTLNTFLYLLILMLAFMWMQRPNDNRLLYATAFAFGIAMTNCQPILLLVPALMLIFFITDRALFRDCFALGLLVIAALIYYLKIYRPSLSAQAFIPNKELWITAVVLMLLIILALWLIGRRLFTEWKRVSLLVLFGGLGLLLILYLPIASEFNPPMNWGYPRTWEGFKHAITRGQYQTLSPAIMPKAMFNQMVMYFRELKDQFTLPLCLIALIPVIYLREITHKDQAWLGSIALTFFFTGAVFLALLNPEPDVQSMFIARVQLLQSIAAFALFLGYGLMLGLAFIGSLTKTRSILICGALILMLPALPILKNVYDKELIRTYGGSDMQGHNFGWQFGNYQLCGAQAITAELKSGEPPLPNPDYPPEMEKDAIFFGGTDPGRFVPTYMIYSAKVRPDVYLITQNALADNTYMHVMRDLYGDSIWIPTPQDTNIAFQKYVEDVHAGRIAPSGAVNIDKNGRVSVQGVQGVMEINGIICKMIFEHNKSKHSFYIEESYVIRWMYPYLELHGLIMKINKEPMPELTKDMIKNDMDFWHWYTKRLLNNNKFIRDAVARKTFSKLRCAIAGVYAYRGLFKEAEFAFQQAVELFPISPEANFRLADLYLKQNRFDDAYTVMETNLKQDARNKKIKGFMQQITLLKQQNKQIDTLQNLLSNGKATLDTVFELATLYQKTGKEQPFYNLTQQLLRNTNLPPQVYIKVAQMYAQYPIKRFDLMAGIFQKYLKVQPADPKAWLELSCIHVALNQQPEAFAALRKAISIGGEPIKELARKDNRLELLHQSKEFQELVTPGKIQLPSFPANLIP